MVEQVISQQTAEHEAVTVRRSSLLDEAIRHLQERQDRQNQLAAEPQGHAVAPPPAPAASTPRRGDWSRSLSDDNPPGEPPEEREAHRMFLLPCSVCERACGRAVPTQRGPAAKRTGGGSATDAPKRPPQSDGH